MEELKQLLKMYLEKDHKALSEMKGTQDEILRRITWVQEDHEKRLRTLERWLYLGMGGLGLVSYIFNVMVKR